MGKTITTYLIDGDPKGTQYAFVSNKTCMMFAVPRSSLAYLNTQERLWKPAFYILLGEDETTKPKAYIGETENFRERVRIHDEKKPFWQKALVFVSKDADLTKADVKYLEYKAIALAKKTNRFTLDENKKIPAAPFLPEWRTDDMDQFFEDVRFLAGFIGCDIFEEAAQTTAGRVFRLSGLRCDARGVYTSDGFIVLQGSVVAKESTPSFKWKGKREDLIKDYTEEADGKLVTTSDTAFKSPSAAAEFCNGSMTNGWIAWKDEEGRTLADVYNHQLE